MKKMTANFYPMPDGPVACKNGAELLGYAQITIGGGFQLNDISVFRSEAGQYHIDFPSFGDGVGYIVPKSKEMYAAMRDVIAMAVEDPEHHFGYNQGEYGFKHSLEHPEEDELQVTGHLVNEPYADGRFSLEVADVCALYGITTAVRNAADGTAFVAVHMPTASSYEKEGERVYVPAFRGIDAHWTNREGEARSFDYGRLLADMVSTKRRDLMLERRPTLDDQVKGADDRRKGQGTDSMTKPEKEPEVVL